MKEFFEKIRDDKTIYLESIINAIFLIATLISILFSYHLLPPFIPIFNQLPWGQERLGNKLTIFIPLLVILLIFLTNSVTATAVYKKIPLVSRMLVTISLLTSILTGLFIAKTLILIL